MQDFGFWQKSKSTEAWQMGIAKYYKELGTLQDSQKKERALMLAHGVTDADIGKLHEIDFSMWKADRNYALHKSASTEEIGEDAMSLAWLRRNHAGGPDGTGGFFDSIGNAGLLAALRGLAPGDLALIKACWVDGATHEEYAAQIGKSRSAVTQKLERLRRKFQAIMKK
jgi:hypothetical protein